MRLADVAPSATGFPRPAGSAGFAAAALVALGIAAVSAGPDMRRLWVLLLLAPLAEEVVFRAGLQESLLRRLRSPPAANALTALAFATAHALARGDASGVAVAIPALLLGAVYGRWRTAWPCVALHASMNAVWLAWGHAGPVAGLGG